MDQSGRQLEVLEEVQGNMTQETTRELTQHIGKPGKKLTNNAHKDTEFIQQWLLKVGLSL